MVVVHRLVSDYIRTLFVVQGGQARLVKVRLGLIDGTNAEILSGVQVNDDVVIQGQNLLTEATPVTIVSNPVSSQN